MSGKYQLGILDTVWKDERWGNGWSWNDYDAAYMAERNSFPAFGNLVSIRPNSIERRSLSDTTRGGTGLKLFETVPGYFNEKVNEYSYMIPARTFSGD